MTAAELEARLREARDYEAWVSIVARRFEMAGLHFGHGTDNAGDEAYWLIRHVQGWREDVWDRPADPELADTVASLAERRINERKPLAYLLGEAWFAGLPFFVDENVLIPRSPLAEVIEHGFSPWADLRPGDRILDVGTGSGCLAVAAAHHCPDVLVDATDVSSAALAIAARNAARHGVADRVRLHHADLFPETAERYRVIMSNPPYVPRQVLESLPPEYAHEPTLALAGGEDGLEPTGRLLREAAERLTPNGVLIVEVGAEADTLAMLHPRLPLTWLELERGGEGIFVVTAEELDAYFGRSPADREA